MWKKLLSENNKKNHRKVKSSQPTCLRLLGSAMNGNKNTNKKNDKNQIKNAHPNPNREEEKRAIEIRENRIKIKRGINLIHKRDVIFAFCDCRERDIFGKRAVGVGT